MKKIRGYEIDGCINTEDEILCKATLYNGRKISKRYENRPDLISHIEKDFEENIVKPRYLQELKNGNLINQIERCAKSKPIVCNTEVRFRDRDNIRNIEKTGLCSDSQEIWKKFLKFGLDKI